MDEEAEFDGACVRALDTAESFVFSRGRLLGPRQAPSPTRDSQSCRGLVIFQDSDRADCCVVTCSERGSRSVNGEVDNCQSSNVMESCIAGLGPEPYFDDASGSWVVICVCGERMHFRCGGGRWGPYYVCPRCPKATHGAHGFSQQERDGERGFRYGEPLGIPCDEETRQWRHKAHEALDPFWQGEENSRHQAYRLLAGLLGKLESDAHIARFSKMECIEAIEAIDALTAAAQLFDE